MKLRWLGSLIVIFGLVAIVIAINKTTASTARVQDLNQIPPELEKYRKERVGQKNFLFEPDTEEEKRMQAIMEHKRKNDAMMEYRRSGNLTLTKEEMEDFIHNSGIRRGVRFDRARACIPQSPRDMCADDGVWMVHLEPHVKVADVDSTIQTLEDRYGVRLHPTLLVDKELPVGAYFVVLGTPEQASNLSRDGDVRLVENDRIGVVMLAEEKINREFAAKIKSSLTSAM